MKLPILVYESCTLDIFDTVEAAELYHEAWIVDDDRVVFYDADGRWLKVEPGTERPVRITCDPNIPPRPQALAEAITGFLVSNGQSPGKLNGLALAELIEIAYPFAHATN